VAIVIILRARQSDFQGDRRSSLARARDNTDAVSEILWHVSIAPTEANF
jgi:hypothetical protein